MFQFIFYKLLFPPRPQALIPALGSYHSQPMLASQPSSSAPVSIHRVPRNRITPNWDFQRSVVSIAILLGFISFVAAEPLDPPQQDTRAERLGQTFAWICCAFYLTSRLPQILENHKRKSTRGIHIALFMAALCGNTCYAVGITTNPLAHDPSQRAEFLYNALPYLLGSAGYVHITGKKLIVEQLFSILLFFFNIFDIGDRIPRKSIVRQLGDISRPTNHGYNTAGVHFVRNFSFRLVSLSTTGHIDMRGCWRVLRRMTWTRHLQEERMTRRVVCW